MLWTLRHDEAADGPRPIHIRGRHLSQVDASTPGVPVSVISIKPSPARWSLVARIEEANRGMKAVVEQRQRGVWIDVFQPMLVSGRPRPELFGEDGLHLNSAGYALWQRVLREHRPAAF